MTRLERRRLADADSRDSVFNFTSAAGVNIWVDRGSLSDDIILAGDADLSRSVVTAAPKLSLHTAAGVT